MDLKNLSSMDNSRERGEMETWWGLEEAMDLLSTSRRLTLRASRVSAVVSRWPLDRDSSSASSRLFQNRYRQPLRSSNVQPKIVEKKTDFKGVESVSKPHQTATDNEELRNKLRHLQEENVKLQTVISELTQVNKRWQKYNSDRQIYVQKLLNTIQDQQEQLNKMGEHCAFQNNEDQESTTPDNKNSITEHEISRLKEVERRLKEKIEVLEFQVKANRDDWEAEHSEKKQAIKEKEEIEQRVNLLMSELQELKQSVIEKRLPKDYLMLCHSCQSRFPADNETANDYPVHSKLYRTAVHLPFSSQQRKDKSSLRASSSANSLNNELAVDGNEENEKNQASCCDSVISVEEKLINSNSTDDNKKTEDDGSDSVCSFKSNFDGDTRNISNIWNIGHSPTVSESSVKQEIGASYSRASTVPLINSPIHKEIITPSNTSSTSSIALTTGSLQEEPIQYQFSTNGGATVTSFMQIPIVKSSSAPDSKSESSTKSFRPSLDSFNLASPSAPIAFIGNAKGFTGTSKNIYERCTEEGVETRTRENIICPNCNTVFPPKMHIEFLDHFDSCQRINL